MNEATIHSELSRQDFFAGMKPDDLDFLAGNAAESSMDTNHIVFHHGEPARTFYLLRSGRVCVEVPAIEGPSLRVQELGAGEILGWSWLIPPYRWSFQARADEPTDLIEFDGRAILSRCENDAEFGYQMFKRFSALMSERLDASRRRMMEEWNPPGFA